MTKCTASLIRTNPETKPGQFQRICRNQLEIDARADGNEKHGQKQAFERIQIHFQFVPVFAFRQNHTGKKSAERR